jgi:hypothetical protein
MLVNVAAALPLAWAMRGQLKDSIGDSLIHEDLRRGFSAAWHGEFAADARGAATTFGPEVIGPLPMLANLERLVEGRIFSIDKTVLAAGAFYLLALALIGGGIIDRYASGDLTHESPGFMAQCGRSFFAFVIYIGVAAGAYYCLFRYGAPELRRLLSEQTRDLTTQSGQWGVMMRTVAIYYLPIGAALVLIGASLDYAKIVTVLRTDEGWFGAIVGAPYSILRGLFFVLGHPIRAIGLYLFVGALGFGLGWAYYLYWTLYRGRDFVGDADPLQMLIVFGVGQAYILLRILLKLWLLASETHLMQSARREKLEVTAAPNRSQAAAAP